jgi:hypothetical protein
MRWKRPKIGDIKVIRRFLFFPLKLQSLKTQNVETRWLEWAMIEYRWEVDYREPKQRPYWIPHFWLND